MTREEYEKVSSSLLLPDLDIDLLSRYIAYFNQYDAVTEFIKAIKN